jgi:hypothetical protein
MPMTKVTTKIDVLRVHAFTDSFMIFSFGF